MARLGSRFLRSEQELPLDDGKCISNQTTGSDLAAKEVPRAHLGALLPTAALVDKPGEGG
jgi:hypothetical protein